MNIVILDGYTANPGDLSWKELEEMGSVTVYDRTKPGDTVARASNAEIVLTNKVIIGRQEMEQMPRLRYVGLLSTGCNAVDIAAAHEHGITVTNVPAYSTEGVAQMVFAHLLNVTNRIDYYANQNRTGSADAPSRQGRWSSNQDFCYWDIPLSDLAGKTFGIVGLGNIGMRVAQIALAFGMKVKALTSKPAVVGSASQRCDTGTPPIVDNDSQQCAPGSTPCIIKADLPELLAASDVLSLHCPLTDGTHHLINAGTLRQMKPTAILINTGRGPLVDDEAVAQALHEGRLAAFCADVLTKEPPSADNPLLKEPNAFITPHIAWASTEARERLLHVAIGNVRAFLDGKPQNVV